MRMDESCASNETPMIEESQCSISCFTNTLLAGLLCKEEEKGSPYHSFLRTKKVRYLNNFSDFTFKFQFVQFQVCCPHLLVTSEKGPGEGEACQCKIQFLLTSTMGIGKRTPKTPRISNCNTDPSQLIPPRLKAGYNTIVQ